MINNKKLKNIFVTLFFILFFVSVAQVKSKALKAQKFQIAQGKPFEAIHMTQGDTQNPVFIFIQFFKKQTIQAAQQVNAINTNQQKSPIVGTNSDNIQKSIVIGKLQNVLRVRITSKNGQIQCIFDQSTDLCTIQKPEIEYNINVDCLVKKNSPNKQCLGQIYIKQAKPYAIPYEQVTKQSKIKYNDGFYELPETVSHSVMLLFCQDEESQISLAKDIKIYSGVKFHRKQNLQAQESNQMVGFTLSKGLKNRYRYVYFQIKSEAVRKCLQFQYHVSSSLTNGKFMLDFVNMTDTTAMVQNIYTYYGNQNTSVKENHFFNYHMHLQLNIFSPNHLLKEENYNMIINVFEGNSNVTSKTNQFKQLKKIGSYTFLSIIPKDQTHKDTHFYAKYSHYHYSYTLSHQFLKQSKKIRIQVLMIPVATSSQNKVKDNFLFIGLKVQDTQNIVVQQLATSYLSVKQGQSLSFTIQQPFQVNQIQTQGQKNKVSDLITIIPSQQSLVTTITEHSTDHDHKSECHFSQGCKFNLVAKKDCTDCAITYLAEFIKGKNDVLLLQVKNNKISGRIQLDQYLYFYYKLGPSELIEIIVNNPNVILYTLEDDKKRQCKLPSKTCKSDIATYKQGAIIQNKASIGQKVVFLAIKGLDNSQFTIRFEQFLNELKLSNGEVFSYRIPPKHDQMRFIFQIPGYVQGKFNHSISFNLISPLNSLQMSSTLLNDKNQQIPTSQKHSTLSGYIKLRPQQIKSKVFLIKLKKQLHFIHESVHFSIIASTSDHKLKLDTGITHYQTLNPKQAKTFIIEYIVSQQYSLGFHTFNVVGKEVHVDLKIQQAEQQSKDSKKDQGQKNIISYAIDKVADKLYLNNDFATTNHLCEDAQDTCQLIITLKNQMDYPIDITLLLIGKQSVIQLKDGVWESFKVDSLLKMSHFYFIPTHQNNPAKIIFKSTNPELQLQAVLFQTGDYINPSEWPYPQTHDHAAKSQFQQQQDQDQNTPGSYTSYNQILIDNQDPNYKKCFPNCVILMSIKDNGDYLDQFNQDDTSEQSISILASNFLIELPQKTKITLQLKKNEENLIFIDLRKVLDKKILTFFTFFSVGFAQIYANVYWADAQNMPTQQQHQFVFDPYQTQITIQAIKQLWLDLLQQQQPMRGVDDEQIQFMLKEEVYLCLLIVADQQTQMTLQFTSDRSTIKQLHLGMTQAIHFKVEQESIFYFIPTKDYQVKFIRNNGYPFFHILTCDHTDNQQCLQYGLNILRKGGIKEKQNLNKQRSQSKDKTDIKQQTTIHDGPFSLMNLNEKQGNHQMIQKTQTKYGKQCSKCIIYIWAYSIQEAQLTIQLRSLNNEIQLQQNHLTSEFLNQNQVNKFSISAVRSEWTIIMIHVEEGSPKVTVNDNLEFEQIQTIKTLNLQNGLANRFKMMVFKVPPIQIRQTKQQQKSKSQQLNSLFSSLHITVQSQDKNPVTYTISYSSGEHILYLDDGVISSHILNANQANSFYYKNKNKKSHVYVTMTVQTANQKIQKALNQLIIKMFYIQTLEGEAQKKYKGQIQPQKPQSGSEMKKKTTLTFELPNYELVQIQITCKQDLKLTIGINHRQIIFLPLNYAFPVQLHAYQEIQIIIQNLIDDAYLQLIIKKCDQSNPLIYYTNDENQFVQDKFSNYDRFGQQNIFKHVSKTKQKATLYLKLESIQTDSTLIVEARYINLEFSLDRIDLAAGNYGILQYQLINSQMAQISLSGLQCMRNCIDNTEYYLVVSESLASIYRDMVCEGHSFQHLQESSDTKNTKIEEISKSKKKPIEINKLLQKPGRTDNKMVVPYKIISPTSFVTIKAIHVPSGEQIYYKHVEITTLTGHLNRLPSSYLYFGVVTFLLGIVALVTMTKVWARRGYQPLRGTQ